MTYKKAASRAKNQFLEKLVIDRVKPEILNLYFKKTQLQNNNELFIRV